MLFLSVYKIFGFLYYFCGSLLFLSNLGVALFVRPGIYLGFFSFPFYFIFCSFLIFKFPYLDIFLWWSTAFYSWFLVNFNSWAAWLGWLLPGQSLQLEGYARYPSARDWRDSGDWSIWSGSESSTSSNTLVTLQAGAGCVTLTRQTTFHPTFAFVGGPMPTCKQSTVLGLVRERQAVAWWLNIKSTIEQGFLQHIFIGKQCEQQE